MLSAPLSKYLLLRAPFVLRQGSNEILVGVLESNLVVNPLLLLLQHPFCLGVFEGVGIEDDGGRLAWEVEGPVLLLKDDAPYFAIPILIINIDLG